MRSFASIAASFVVLSSLAAVGCAADAAADDADAELGATASSELGSGISVPNPSGAYVANVTANGMGCPAGTWDAKISRDGKTFEVAFMKRPSNNWQLNASFSRTQKHIPVTCAAAGTGLGPFVNRCYLDPNTTFNSADDTVEAQAKISGAYNLPYGILASANYDIRSGTPQARQVLFTGGSTIRSISLNVEPIGTFGLPRTHAMDVRVAKRFVLGSARSVEVRGDIYNVLNKGTVTVWNLQSGPNYLRPSRILFPRILQFGATFTF